MGIKTLVTTTVTTNSTISLAFCHLLFFLSDLNCILWWLALQTEAPEKGKADDGGWEGMKWKSASRATQKLIGKGQPAQPVQKGKSKGKEGKERMLWESMCDVRTNESKEKSLKVLDAVSHASASMSLALLQGIPTV